MGRLFWKFFFSYWAALLLGVAGVAGAAWLSRLSAGDLNLSLAAGPPAGFVVSSAAATLRHGGVLALRDLLRDWHQDGAMLVFAVDEAGQELLERPVPPGSLERARDVVATQGSAKEARQVRVPEGAYLLFVPTEAMPFGPRVLFGAVPPHPSFPLIIGALSSLAFGALLAWYVAKPIGHLRSAFAAVSSGQFDTRVTPLMGRRRDEVADLGRDFDRMAQHLQSLIASQRSLLHDVSHELRSPLARLQAAIGLARQDPRRLEGSLERIEREVERVNDLVDQLLTLSRLETGAGEAAMHRLEQVNLMDLVASIAADAHFEAQSTGRSVAFAAEGDAVVPARVELLHRAIENVLRNAVRHTLPGTTVVVNACARLDSDELRLTVADRGPGVAEHALELIFEPFYRGPETHAGPGFGLGLAITRRAIEAHGGRVRARNRVGGGLEIDIELPIASAPAGNA